MRHKKGAAFLPLLVLFRSDQLRSVIAKDVAGTVGRAIVTSGEIVAQVAIPSRFPIDHQAVGHIHDVVTEILSEICLVIVTPTVTLIAAIDVGHVAHLIDQGINCLVTDRLTTTHILLVIVTEIGLVVSVDELQHVIQSIIILQTLIDELYGVSVENFFVVSGQGDGHL